MLTKRQIEIIKELNDKDKLTAQNLASSLHVSTKTIRNDIHAINAMYPNSIEAMQASGFKLTNNEIFALIKKTKLNSNNTDVEFLVLKHLMSRTSTYIDDLSDDLFISSTSLLKIKLLFCKWVVIIRLFTMFRAHCIPISHFFWR